jgi:hypothetical protein
VICPCSSSTKLLSFPLGLKEDSKTIAQSSYIVFKHILLVLARRPCAALRETLARSSARALRETLARTPPGQLHQGHPGTLHPWYIVVPGTPPWYGGRRRGGYMQHSLTRSHWTAKSPKNSAPPAAPGGSQGDIPPQHPLAPGPGWGVRGGGPDLARALREALRKPCAE